VLHCLHQRCRELFNRVCWLLPLPSLFAGRRWRCRFTFAHRSAIDDFLEQHARHLHAELAKDLRGQTLRQRWNFSVRGDPIKPSTVDLRLLLTRSRSIFMLRFGMNLNIRKVLLSKMRVIVMNLRRAFMTHKIIVALRYPIEQELPIQVNIFGLKIDTV
jgi:hypothetical protein